MFGRAASGQRTAVRAAIGSLACSSGRSRACPGFLRQRRRYVRRPRRRGPGAAAGVAESGAVRLRRGSAWARSGPRRELRPGHGHCIPPPSWASTCRASTCLARWCAMPAGDTRTSASRSPRPRRSISPRQPWVACSAGGRCSTFRARCYRTSWRPSPRRWSLAARRSLAPTSATARWYAPRRTAASGRPQWTVATGRRGRGRAVAVPGTGPAAVRLG